eukprot:m.238925 g.238925  ORF g.238925 m.238925 type:complete len:819 (+) comp22140_c0_seq1:48-2504(+)
MKVRVSWISTVCTTAVLFLCLLLLLQLLQGLGARRRGQHEQEQQEQQTQHLQQQQHQQQQPFQLLELSPHKRPISPNTNNKEKGFHQLPKSSTKETNKFGASLEVRRKSGEPQQDPQRPSPPHSALLVSSLNKGYNGQNDKRLSAQALASDEVESAANEGEAEKAAREEREALEWREDTEEQKLLSRQHQRDVDQDEPQEEVQEREHHHIKEEAHEQDRIQARHPPSPPLPPAPAAAIPPPQPRQHGHRVDTDDFQGEKEHDDTQSNNPAQQNQQHQQQQPLLQQQQQQTPSASTNESQSDLMQQLAKLQQELHQLREEKLAGFDTSKLSYWQRLKGRQPNTTCSELVAAQRVFANYSEGLHRVASAWEAARANKKLPPPASGSHKYCMVRCGLVRCCQDALMADTTTSILSIKDTITLGVPVSEANAEEDEETRKQRVRDFKAATSTHMLAGALDVTLVTHGTVDRLAAFSVINEVWDGPKVVVFVVPTLGKNSTATAAIKTIEKAAQHWTNVRVLVCLFTATQDFFTARLGASSPQMPINALRNIAVDYAPTNYVFPLDMDFIPSRRLYAKLRRTYLPLLSHVDRVAVVLPHWETLKCQTPPTPSTSSALAKELPLSFAELDAQVRAGRAQPFHVRTDMIIPATYVGAVDVAPGCATGTDNWLVGIQASNYPRWYRSSLSQREGLVPLPLPVRPQMLRNYEPFVLVRRVDPDGTLLPRYQEEFVGRYKNKVAWITTLRTHRYQFHIMLSEFVLHMPHEVKDQTTPDMQRHFHAMERLFWREQNRLVREVMSSSGSRFPGWPKPSPYPRGFVCTVDT